MYLVIRCPNCKKLQIFKPASKDPKKWKKRCVFCGYTFIINPKSKHSSTTILFYSEDISKVQEFIKKNQTM